MSVPPPSETIRQSSPAITTLHRLQAGCGAALEADLRGFAAENPAALLLPCHIREIGTPALRRIVEELRGADWLRRIVIGLDGAQGREVAEAARAFAGLPQEVSILWTGHPALEALSPEAAGGSGKGRNVWLCAGFVLTHPEIAVAAVHDCDVLDYSRELVARLCWPVMHPRTGLAFCKGWYSRHSDRLHGRVMRFLVAPLLEAVRAGRPDGLAGFLGQFRYPIAGETALRTGLLRQLPFEAGWGLEAGLLCGVHRRIPAAAVCQSQLCERYEHRHHDLSHADPANGLHRMAREVAGTLLRELTTAEGPVSLEHWPAALQRALQQAEAEAEINSLAFDKAEAALAGETFTLAVEAAAGQPGRELPAWEVVFAENPEAAERLRAALV